LVRDLIKEKGNGASVTENFTGKKNSFHQSSDQTRHTTETHIGPSKEYDISAVCVLPNIKRLEQISDIQAAVWGSILISAL
jgi:hypothetical protein